MSRILLSFLLLFSSDCWAQDYSKIGKKIAYSDSLNKAKKFRNIDKALENPADVVCLIISDYKGDQNIEKFLSNVDKFKNLRKLIMRNQSGDLVGLKKGLWQLHKLEYLVLSNFPNSSVRGIDKLKKLKYLSLDGLNFRGFPQEILELSELELLDLSCNRLSSLPDSIGNLERLRELELTNNCFREFPKGIGQIKSLEYLTINNAERGAVLVDGTSVCDNEISEFPDFLNQAVKLKWVSCFFKVEMDLELRNKLVMGYPEITFK